MTKNYSDGNVLTEAMLDAMKSSTETFLNTTKLDGDNIQDSAIVTAKINNSAVDENKIATSVAGNGLTGGAGTALAVQVDDTGIEISSDTLQLKDDGVVTAKILDANVTWEKLEAFTGGISSPSGAFTTTSTTDVDVTNMSVTFTSNGRPCVIAAICDDGTDLSFMGIGTSAANRSAFFSILKDGTTTIGTSEVLGISGETLRSGAATIYYDVPSSGSVTYKMQARVTSGSGSPTAYVNEMKLLVYEI